jgi:hypothetical protein
MKRSIKVILFTCCVGALIVFSCKKKETVEVDNETQSSVDNAVADQEYAAIVPAVNNHAINTKGTGVAGKFVSPCDTLTWLNQTGPSQGYGQANISVVNGKYVVPAIYELNLGTACAQSFSDGKTRTGKWIIRITGPLKLAGSQMIIKLQNHKTNGTISYACDSMIVTTTNADTINAKYTYNIKLVNAVCSSSSWTIKYASDRTITHYIKGNPSGTDPKTEVYGTATGTNRQGRTFSVNIPSTSPLVKYKSCQYIQSGIMTLTPDGFKERTIDFGYSLSPNPAGGCDDDASFTVNGNTVAFKLK